MSPYLYGVLVWRQQDQDRNPQDQDSENAVLRLLLWAYNNLYLFPLILDFGY